MTAIFGLVIPFLFLATLVLAKRKKVRAYDSFTEGIKGVVPLLLSTFPYLAAVSMLMKLMEVSGLGAWCVERLAPVFEGVGVPKEIVPLVLMKPLSGSGGLATLSGVLERHGVDSYISRCACVVYGSSETIFYVGAVYFADVKRNGLAKAMGIAVAAYLAATVFACFVCRIL